MAIPSRIQDRQIVLSKLKQANYATVVTDVNLGLGKRFSPNSPVFGQPVPQFYTNRPQTMKGHDYTTVRQEVEREYSEQITFDGDSWLLAWALAFVMGKVTSTQPNAGGNPTCYKHVIKPLDPGTDGKDLPTTTVYVEAANSANFKRRMKSCAVRDISIDLPPSDTVKLGLTLQGSGDVAVGALAGAPALTVMQLLFSNNMVFKYGAQGGPADITSEIVRGSVHFGFTWNLDDGNSRGPGDGLYRSRAWVGTPQISLQFSRMVDDAASTPQDDWLAGTVQEVKISVPGPVIGPGPETYLLEIRGLAVVPEAIKIGQQGDKSIYQYTIGPDHWKKEGAADVVTVTVQNLETSYLV